MKTCSRSGMSLVLSYIFAPMETCSRAGTTMMSLSYLCRLVLRALRRIRAFPAASPERYNKITDEHVRPPSTPPEAAAAAVGTESLAELPVDILMDIFALLEIPDLIRAGSVCSTWHAAYTSLRSHCYYQRRRLQTPCLLYTSESDADDVACLYSLAENRVYKLTLPAPPISSRYLIGCSKGWLVTADESSELHIVNPITGEQVALPPVATIEQVKPTVFDEAGAVQEYKLAQYYGEDVIASGTPPVCAPNNLRDYLYVKAYVFTVDPLAGGGYIVVLIHNPDSQLSFARVGDSQWTWLPPSAAYEDCMYMDGLLYAVTSTGGIEAFDLTGPNVVRKVIMDDTKDFIYEHLYLVQTPSGDVLQVWREQNVVPWQDEGEDAPERDPSEIITETRKIMIHKVDMVAKELVPVNSLHGPVLFLGHSQSQCISAQEYPHLKENHVYMADDELCMAHWKSSRRDVGLFNLEYNITEEIVPPQLWCSWPAPIWITPNFTNFGIGM